MRRRILESLRGRRLKESREMDLEEALELLEYHSPSSTDTQIIVEDHGNHREVKGFNLNESKEILTEKVLRSLTTDPLWIKKARGERYVGIGEQRIYVDMSFGVNSS